MVNIIRSVTKKGVYIKDRLYSGPDLAAMIGELVSVALPEGPLPQELIATFGSHVLKLRCYSRDQLHNYGEIVSARKRLRIVPLTSTDMPLGTLSHDGLT